MPNVVVASSLPKDACLKDNPIEQCTSQDGLAEGTTTQTAGSTGKATLVTKGTLEGTISCCDSEKQETALASSEKKAAPKRTGVKDKDHASEKKKKEYSDEVTTEPDRPEVVAAIRSWHRHVNRTSDVTVLENGETKNVFLIPLEDWLDEKTLTAMRRIYRDSRWWVMNVVPRGTALKWEETDPPEDKPRIFPEKEEPKHLNARASPSAKAVTDTKAITSDGANDSDEEEEDRRTRIEKWEISHGSWIPLTTFFLLLGGCEADKNPSSSASGQENMAKKVLSKIRDAASFSSETSPEKELSRSRAIYVETEEMGRFGRALHRLWKQKMPPVIYENPTPIFRLFFDFIFELRLPFIFRENETSEERFARRNKKYTKFMVSERVRNSNNSTTGSKASSSSSLADKSEGSPSSTMVPGPVATAVFNEVTSWFPNRPNSDYVMQIGAAFPTLDQVKTTETHRVAVRYLFPRLYVDAARAASMRTELVSQLPLDRSCHKWFESLREDVYVRHASAVCESEGGIPNEEYLNKILADDNIYKPKAAVGRYAECAGNWHDTIRVPFCHAATSASRISGEIMRWKGTLEKVEKSKLEMILDELSSSEEDEDESLQQGNKPGNVSTESASTKKTSKKSMNPRANYSSNILFRDHSEKDAKGKLPTESSEVRKLSVRLNDYRLHQLTACIQSLERSREPRNNERLRTFRGS
ncbi:unnamed protein product [Amoebophrya sp. A25]|nr:unnamed protein product [Amoebophrya sp. A25]|eukprot:GSA25T00027082001.1